MRSAVKHRTQACSVTLRDITKVYGSHRAVDQLNLEVKQGEFLTLLGPSGCGKTTTLRTIAGLEQPASGAVLFGDKEVTKDPPNLRAVNTVFQSYALFPHLSVFENVAFGLRRRRVSNAEIAERVEKQLTMMALVNHRDKRPYQLSGGEQQRVALARALVLEPAVLLLDEPFASLDFKLRQRLQIELKALQRETGISFVMVTHDQNEALAMSDRVAVMNKGHIEQLGEPIEVYERPATAFVAGFLGDANFVDAELISRTEGDAVVRIGETASFRGTCLTEADLGEHVQLFVRPEDVRVGTSGPAGHNCLRGVVEATVIVGGLDRKVLVRIETGRGTNAIVESLVRADSDVSFGEGDTVDVSWPVAKTRVFGKQNAKPRTVIGVAS